MGEITNESFKIYVNPFEIGSNNVELTWKPVSQSGKKLEIKLTFGSPLEVSPNEV